MSNDPLIGRQLANYKIERIIGRGGMALVYYGVDVKLERSVAIKVIDARYRDDPSYAERFIKEAKAVATWRHDNIIQIYYADDQDGYYYFAMEFIDGFDLGQFMAEYRTNGELVPHDEVLRIGRIIANALDYAHKQGVIHRDIKPANVMIAKDGRVILTDFGLALDVQQGSMGQVFGSSHYIAPEQARRSADAIPQSDLYSLGVVLYEMFTGLVPFDDPSPTAVAVQHMTVPPPPPRQLNSDLSEEIETVLLKALSKEPPDRYQTGKDLIDALELAIKGTQPAPEEPKETTHAPSSERLLASQDNLIGYQLDEYRLEKLLGRGGMAAVYQGVDIHLERRVAIKVIDTPFRAESDYIKRFKQEAKAVAQLEHGNIVRLYRYGEVNKLLYIAMQYIEGGDLYALLNEYNAKKQYLTPEQILQIIKEVCGALDYAHQKGVIHRDVKPSNIMINPEGHAVLTDFGLALLTAEGTRGEILGSPHYLAPEQAMSSANAVPQSDLYAVGVILYRMSTGKLPFDAEEPLEVAMMQMSEAPPPPREIRPELSEALETVILKSLAKEPQDRYPSGLELTQALAEALQLKPESTTDSVPVPVVIEETPATEKPAESDSEPSELDSEPSELDSEPAPPPSKPIKPVASKSSSPPPVSLPLMPVEILETASAETEPAPPSLVDIIAKESESKPKIVAPDLVEEDDEEPEPAPPSMADIEASKVETESKTEVDTLPSPPPVETKPRAVEPPTKKTPVDKATAAETQPKAVEPPTKKTPPPTVEETLEDELPLMPAQVSSTAETKLSAPPPSILTKVSQEMEEKGIISPVPASKPSSLTDSIKERVLSQDKAEQNKLFAGIGAVVVILLLLCISISLFSSSQSGEDEIDQTPDGASIGSVETETPAKETPSIDISAATNKTETPSQQIVEETPTSTDSTDTTPTIEETPTPGPPPDTTPTPTPTLSPLAAYQLLYTYWDGGKHFICTANLDGADDGADEDCIQGYSSSPSWNEKGDKYAFIAEPGFGDGSKTIRLSNKNDPIKEDSAARSVALSPDGKRIAYDANYGGGFNTYFIDTNGKAKGETVGEMPAWAYDSSQIAVKACAPDCGVWIVGKDSAWSYQLTGSGSDAFPAWSPDSKKIAFSRDMGGNQPDIFIIDVDEPANVVNLTQSGGIDALATWSPDGNYIAFRTTRNGYWQIYVMEADGSNPQPVTNWNIGAADDWAVERLSVIKSEAKKEKK